MVSKFRGDAKEAERKKKKRRAPSGSLERNTLPGNRGRETKSRKRGKRGGRF